jgi:hypothetical protein
MTRRSRQYAALLVIGICAALFAAGLGIAAVREGWAAPPRIDLSFGPARLVGGTTVMPLCPQFVACMMDRPSPVIRVYSLWVLTPGNAQHPGPQGIRVTQLVSLPLQ